MSEIQVLIKTVQKLVDNSLTGTKPLVEIGTTVLTDVNGFAIYAISDATFTTLETSADGDALAAQTLSAGHIWYIPINSVTLAGGAVIIYRHTNV